MYRLTWWKGHTRFSTAAGLIGLKDVIKPAPHHLLHILTASSSDFKSLSRPTFQEVFKPRWVPVPSHEPIKATTDGIIATRPARVPSSPPNKPHGEGHEDSAKNRWHIYDWSIQASLAEHTGRGLAPQRSGRIGRPNQHLSCEKHFTR